MRTGIVQLKKALLPPFSLRARDRRVADLFHDKGIVWSSDIFRAEFGEFPMKGIDVTPQTFIDEPVFVKSIFADSKSGLLKKIFYSVAAAGYVHGEGDDPDIHLNTVIYSPVGQFALGYFTGQGKMRINFLRLRSLGELIFGMGVVDYKDLLIFGSQLLSSARYQSLAGIIQIAASSISDTIGHEHIHVRQLKHATREFHDQNAKPFATFLRAKRKEIDKGSLKKLIFDMIEMGGNYWQPKYYIADYEVQARLHTIMTQGYKRWGRLPGTQQELFDALADLGLPVPRGMESELSPRGAKTPFRRRMKLRRLFRAYTDPSTADLAAAQNNLYFPELKVVFWTGMLAYQYGLLLEYYGDPLGREKLGFTKDPVILPADMQPPAQAGDKGEEDAGTPAPKGKSRVIIVRSKKVADQDSSPKPPRKPRAPRPRKTPDPKPKV